MNHEEHDDLWNLLGQAKPVEVSPFFSRNVLRAIREEQPQKTSVFAWFVRRSALVAAGACAVVIAMVALIPRPEKTDSVMLLAEQVTASPDYQVISNLDELLDAQASSVWLENPAN